MAKSKRAATDESSARPAKRARGDTKSATSAASAASATAAPTASTAAEAVPLPKPRKRPQLPGKVRKLALPKPATRASRAAGSTKPQVGKDGAKINGPDGTGGYRAGDSVAHEIVELFVSRKTQYAAYLRRGLDAFVLQSAKELHIHGLGAAIPMALSLGLAVNDHLPGGPLSSRVEVTTTSVDVHDEVDPGSEDEEALPAMQTRTKSAVKLVITLNAPLPRTTAERGSGRAKRSGRGRGRGR